MMYRIGGYRTLWYVAVRSGKLDLDGYEISEYLHPDGNLYDICGNEGYFNSELEAENAAVKHQNKDQLPEPNNDIPNESILMEGCRLIDEGTQEVPVK